MQISCGVHTEVPAEGVVSPNPGEMGEVFRSLAERWECKVEEGHRMPDHVHMLLSVPLKHSVSNVMGFIKGKSAIHIARVYAGKRRNFVGQHFGARGYWVSTVGKDEAAVRQYIQDQEKEDQRLEQTGDGGALSASRS
jgi:putative transposase